MGDDMIEEDVAKQMAYDALVESGSKCHGRYSDATRIDSNMRLGKQLSGWLIYFKLDIPEGFEPDYIFVEVYDNGRVHIPEIY